LVTPSANPHLILVGLPGSGKSTVGQAVAQRLNRPFLDFDTEIERRTGMAIGQIFREKGENAFRELELALTREVAQSSGMILSPGGGWIAVAEALDLVRPPSRLIYLRVNPSIALSRMGAGRSTRPLLQAPDPLAEIAKLLQAREHFYSQADHIVDVDHIDLQQVTDIVSRLASGEEGR